MPNMPNSPRDSISSSDSEGIKRRKRGNVMVMGDALAKLNLSDSGTSSESPKKTLATAFFN